MLWKSGGLNSFLKRNRIIGLVLLVGLVGLGSGSGLKGDCNLNYHRFRKGHAFEWIEKNTDLKSVIAGHPVHVDPVLLFAKRRVYVSSEVAHPFYPKFYQEMERRLKISLRAHYAKTFNEFLDIINLENIDYFIFSRQRFYGHALKKATFYKPLDQLVAELTSRNYTDYAYKRLPKKVDVEHYPFLVFRDDQSAVVDLKVLRKYVKDHPEFGEGTA